MTIKLDEIRREGWLIVGNMIDGRTLIEAESREAAQKWIEEWLGWEIEEFYLGRQYRGDYGTVSAHYVLYYVCDCGQPMLKEEYHANDGQCEYCAIEGGEE